MLTSVDGDVCFGALRKDRDEKTHFDKTKHMQQHTKWHRVLTAVWLMIY